MRLEVLSESGILGMWFYGDSRPSKSDGVIVFRLRGVACDYTECGIFIASKYATLEKPVKMTLGELLESLPKDERVYADNNGFSKFFREHGIKTVGDFLRVLEALESE
ncbi:hypothetical protein DRP04_07945 [Archaeoglobales archaeon]|nr:MAG: hypothetical protein DRP04_07945 [Archaeoglobales archaeon]